MTSSSCRRDSMAAVTVMTGAPGTWGSIIPYPSEKIPLPSAITGTTITRPSHPFLMSSTVKERRGLPVSPSTMKYPEAPRRKGTGTSPLPRGIPITTSITWRSRCRPWIRLPWKWVCLTVSIWETAHCTCGLPTARAWAGWERRKKAPIPMARRQDTKCGWWIWTIKSPSPWAGGPPHGRHLSMASGIQQETGSMGWTW